MHLAAYNLPRRRYSFSAVLGTGRCGFQRGILPVCGKTYAAQFVGIEPSQHLEQLSTSERVRRDTFEQAIQDSGDAKHVVGAGFVRLVPFGVFGLCGDCRSGADLFRRRSWRAPALYVALMASAKT